MKSGFPARRYRLQFVPYYFRSRDRDVLGIACRDVGQTKVDFFKAPGEPRQTQIWCNNWCTGMRDPRLKKFTFVCRTLRLWRLEMLDKVQSRKPREQWIWDCSIFRVLLLTDDLFFIPKHIHDNKPPSLSWHSCLSSKDHRPAQGLISLITQLSIRNPSWWAF